MIFFTRLNAFVDRRKLTDRRTGDQPKRDEFLFWLFETKMVEEFGRNDSVSCLEQETINVNFACQRCCQPLRIHKSFSTIDRTGDDEDDDEETKGEFEMYKQFPYLVESGLNVNDFLLVDGMGANSRASHFSSSNTSPTSQLTNQVMARAKGAHVKPPVDDLNYNLRVTSRLFDVLSDQSNVNHPLCEECADFIIDQMDSQLKVLEDECKVYREFLENLDKQKVGDRLSCVGFMSLNVNLFCTRLKVIEEH